MNDSPPRPPPMTAMRCSLKAMLASLYVHAAGITKLGVLLVKTCFSRLRWLHFKADSALSALILITLPVARMEWCEYGVVGGNGEECAERTCPIPYRVPFGPISPKSVNVEGRKRTPGEAFSQIHRTDTYVHGSITSNFIP